MSSIFDHVPVPKWRILAYATCSGAGVAYIGYASHDRSLYYVAAPCGIVVGLFGLLLSKARTVNIDERLRQTAPREWLRPEPAKDPADEAARSHAEREERRR